MLAVALAGCAPTGDLGRSSQDLFSFSFSSGGASSALPFTAAETELRHRARHFLASSEIVPSLSSASPTSLYRTISEEAEADAKLIGPFVETAKRVIAADAARLRAARVLEVPRDDGAAEERVRENRCLIAGVRDAWSRRFEAYRRALARTFIAMPQEEAASVERAIATGEAQARLFLAGIHDIACSVREAS